MTKPIIGIIGRRDKVISKIDREGNIILYDYMTPLDKEGATYIGLITNNNYDFIDENVLALCDGFLMTGGVEIKTYHINIIKYAIKHKLPFLGICQGAQALGLSSLTGVKLTNLDDSQGEAVHAPKITSSEQLSQTIHKVNFKEDSLLYKLFGPSIEVNSNHHYALPMVADPIKVVGESEDGIIEAVEHIDSDLFIVGVQWHPENLESMQPLFKEFVDKSKKKRRKW